jgi:hypothetical protein
MVKCKLRNNKYIDVSIQNKFYSGSGIVLDASLFFINLHYKSILESIQSSNNWPCKHTDCTSNYHFVQTRKIYGYKIAKSLLDSIKNEAIKCLEEKHVQR